MRTFLLSVFVFIVAWLAFFGAAVLLLLLYDYIYPAIPEITKGAFK